MNKIVRKILMILSSIFLLSIVVCMIYNLMNRYEPNNTYVYIIEIIFGLGAGIYILSKSYFDKEKFQNNELNMVLVLFEILIYICSIGIFIYETFFVFEQKISSYGGIVGVMIMYNTMFLVLEVKKSRKNQ